MWFARFAFVGWVLLGVVGAHAAYESHERLHFYTHVEPDHSNAEAYEMALWLEVPFTLLSLAGAALAGRAAFRRAAR